MGYAAFDDAGTGDNRKDPVGDAAKAAEAQKQGKTGTDNIDAQTAEEEARRLAAAEAEAAEKQRQAEIQAAKDRAEKAFEYGGDYGQAATNAIHYRDLANAAQNRKGENIDYRAAQGWEQGSLNQFHDQIAMAELMRARAEGRVPSIAQMQADRQMRQMAAEQSSAAASARGPAALALAQQQGAANTAAGQSNISNMAQINAANERMQAENSAFGAYTGIRGQNIINEDLAAKQAQEQAKLLQAQRAQNDAYSAAMANNEIRINEAQLQAQENKINSERGFMYAGEANARANSAEKRAARQEWLGPALGLGGAIAGGTAVALINNALGGGSGKQGGGTSSTGQPGQDPGPGGYNNNAAPDGSLNPGTSGGEYGQGTYGNPSDPYRAKGGPVSSGHPYVVGERGPEIIVPSHDGYVLTAEQSRPLMASDFRAKVPAAPSLSAAMAGAQRLGQLGQSPPSQSAYQPQQNAALPGPQLPGPQSPTALPGPQLPGPQSPAALPGPQSVALPGPQKTSFASFSSRPTTPTMSVPSMQPAPMPSAATTPTMSMYSDMTSKRPAGFAMYSDARAKQEAYALGRAHGFEQVTGGKPVEWAYERPADIVDRAKAPAGTSAHPWDAARITTAPPSGESADITEARTRQHPRESASKNVYVQGGDYDATVRGKATPAQVEAQRALDAAKPAPAVDMVMSEAPAAPRSTARNSYEGAQWDESNPGVRIGRYLSSKLPHQSDEQKLKNDFAVAAARNKANRAATPVLYNMGRTLQEMSPGSREFGQAAASKFKSGVAEPVASYVSPAARDEGDIDAPAGRQPVQMQREFSNEEEKDAYLKKMYSDDRTKLAAAYADGHKMGATHRRGVGEGFGAPPADRVDDEYLGPSGVENEDPGDYNFVKSRSPADIAQALRQDPRAITPKTEAYMRREGMWTDKTDAMLRDQNIRAPHSYTEPDVISGASKAVRDNGPMANAARSMVAQPYAYKPEYARRSGQQPGEVNVGPMAQNMARDEVAGTAVKPDTHGMLTLDRDKLQKVQAGIAADQQRQLDEQNAKIEGLLNGYKASLDAGPSVGSRDREAPEWLDRYMRGKR